MKNIKTFTQTLNEQMSSDTSDLNMELKNELHRGMKVDQQNVIELIRQGADPNAKISGTPMLKFAIGGSTQVMQLLIDEGADPNEEDRGSPLIWDALLRGYPDDAKILIDAGGDVNASMNLSGGNPMLITAMLQQKFRIAGFLIDLGADVNLCDSAGRSPLMIAVAFGATTLAKKLISRGADLEKRDNSGQNPLHYSVYREIKMLEGPEGSRLLIKSGADPFTEFKTADDLVHYFNGNIDWMPDELKTKIKRMQQESDLFGEF